MTVMAGDEAGIAAAPTRPRHVSILVAAAVVAILVAAGVVGIALSDGGSSAGAQQLSATRQACQQWMGGYQTVTGEPPASGWCTSMTDWMGQQLRGGHMTGAMMWGDATAMRSACRAWMSTGPASASGVSPQACDDMISWMAGHAGNWGGWMMTGRMMGQGP